MDIILGHCIWWPQAMGNCKAWSIIEYYESMTTLVSYFFINLQKKKKKSALMLKEGKKEKRKQGICFPTPPTPKPQEFTLKISHCP